MPTLSDFVYTIKLMFDDKAFMSGAKRVQRSADGIIRSEMGMADAILAVDKRIKGYRQGLKEGSLTQRQFAAAVDEAQRSLAALKHGAVDGGNQLARYNNAIYGATQRSKRFASVGLQQVGYQVGDFAVQMQGGTNVAVAFGQQMSQLLGIFGAGGALAGAGVAIGTAFIAPLIEASKKAEDVEKNMQELNDAFDEYEKILGRIHSSTPEIEEDFGRLAESIRNVAKAVEGIRLEELRRELAEVSEAAVEGIMPRRPEGFFAQIMDFTKASFSDLGVFLNPFDYGPNANGISDYQERAMQPILDDLGEDWSPERLANLQESINLAVGWFRIGYKDAEWLAKDFERIITKLTSEITPDEDLSEELIQFIAGLTAAQEEAARMATAKERELAEEKERLAEEDKARQEEEAARLEAAYQRRTEQLQNYSNEVMVQIQQRAAARAKAEEDERKAAEEQRKLDELRHQQDLRYQEQRNKREEEAAKKRQEQLDLIKRAKDLHIGVRDVTNEILNGNIQVEEQLRLQVEEGEKLQEELGSSYRAALALAGVDINSGITTAAEAARLLAENLKISLANASMIVQLAQEDTVMSMPIGENPWKEPEDTKRSRGGGSREETLDEKIAKLYEQIKLERQLLDLSEDEVDIIRELGITWEQWGTIADSATVKAILAQKELIKEIERNKEEVADLSESISSSFESGLMSIVDGTESMGEAFKRMAQEIINELFRILIVQRLVAAMEPMIGSFSGFATSVGKNADGNVFENGRVQPFASGGVVSSPTYFPMAKGVGLMGEAGPEAILPLKRGSDGKLGVASSGGGSPVNVVINNYSNEQAEVKQNGQNLEVVIGQVISRDIQNGGPTYRAMRKTFGLRQPTTGRG